ncbi:MAG: hypothetical protein U5R31_03315 [Acidimicrobiia bacterium]|nr:hypothetical protein [Acidimicrobiia bacterium]
MLSGEAWQRATERIGACSASCSTRPGVAGAPPRRGPTGCSTSPDSSPPA